MTSPLQPDAARLQPAAPGHVPVAAGKRSRRAAVAAVAASPVAQARQALAGSQAQGILPALERDLVAGKGKRLRKALARLPLTLVEREPRQEESARHADGARRGETAHVGQPPVRVHLPLPDEGEASVRFEEEAAGERRFVRVDLDLQLAELGSVGVHLLADEGSLRCTIVSSDPQARAFLEGALATLQGELVQAFGRPTSVALERAPAAVDAYA